MARGVTGNPKLTIESLRVDRFKYWEKGRAMPLYRAEIFHNPSGQKMLDLKGFVSEDYFEKAIIIAKRNLSGLPPLRIRFTEEKK